MHFSEYRIKIIRSLQLNRIFAFDLTFFLVNDLKVNPFAKLGGIAYEVREKGQVGRHQRRRRGGDDPD